VNITNCGSEMLGGISLVPSFPKVRIYFQSQNMLYLFSTNFTGFFQGIYFPSGQVSQRVLAAAWCLIAFVFVNVYSSTLTSYLSVTYQRPTINSLRDLAFTPSYRVTVLTGSIQDIDLQVRRYIFCFS